MVVVIPPAPDLQPGGLHPGVHSDEPVAGRYRRPPRAGHVEIGHQSHLRRLDLLFAQHRVGPDLGQEPVAEVRRGLYHAAAEEIEARIEEVRRDREQPSQRYGLLPEDAKRQGVALLAVLADQLGGLAHRQAASSWPPYLVSQ